MNKFCKCKESYDDAPVEERPGADVTRAPAVHIRAGLQETHHPALRDPAAPQSPPCGTQAAQPGVKRGLPSPVSHWTGSPGKTWALWRRSGWGQWRRCRQHSGTAAGAPAAGPPQPCSPRRHRGIACGRPGGGQSLYGRPAPVHTAGPALYTCPVHPHLGCTAQEAGVGGPVRGAGGAPRGQVWMTESKVCARVWRMGGSGERSPEHTQEPGLCPAHSGQPPWAHCHQNTAAPLSTLLPTAPHSLQSQKGSLASPWREKYTRPSQGTTASALPHPLQLQEPPVMGPAQLWDRDPLQGCRLRSKRSDSSNTRMVAVTTGQQDLSPGGLWGSTQQAQCFPTTSSRRPAARTCQPRGLCSEVRFRRKNVALKTFIDANTWGWCHPQGTHMRRGDQGGGDSAERDPTHLCSALRQEPHRKLASEMTCVTLPCFTEPLLRNAERSFSFKWERK